MCEWVDAVDEAGRKQFIVEEQAMFAERQAKDEDKRKRLERKEKGERVFAAEQADARAAQRLDAQLRAVDNPFASSLASPSETEQELAAAPTEHEPETLQTTAQSLLSTASTSASFSSTSASTSASAADERTPFGSSLLALSESASATATTAADAPHVPASTAAESFDYEYSV